MRAITFKKFKAWLESKHPRTKVGHPTKCTTCPLAKFLIQTTGNRYEVESHGAYCHTKSEWSALPLWAQKFIQRVDKEKSETVSARKCLSLLEECR